MYDAQIKKSILTKLKLGSIQPFQVKEELTRACLPGFKIDKLTEEILEDYKKMHPCF